MPNNKSKVKSFDKVEDTRSNRYQKSRVVSPPQEVVKLSKQENIAGLEVKQFMVGRVVSAKQSGTVSVLIERKKSHPLYTKSFRRSKKYLAQDNLGVVEGDVVEIVKIKPISKRKHWAVVKTIGKDIEAIVAKQLKEEAAQVISEVMPEEKEEELEGEKLEKNNKDEIKQDLQVKNKNKKSNTKNKKLNKKEEV